MSHYMNYHSRCWNLCFDSPPTPLQLAVPHPVMCPAPTATQCSVRHSTHLPAGQEPLAQLQYLWGYHRENIKICLLKCDAIWFGTETNVYEEPAAFIFSIKEAALVRICQTMWHHIPEGHNLVITHTHLYPHLTNSILKGGRAQSMWNSC